jgi:Holliday junction resolvasome RuvABC ATP-dependent DNA helicase subunit
MKKKERKKERKRKICERRKRIKEKEKEKRGGSNKDMIGMNQVKEKLSVRKDVALLRDETFNHVQSDNEDDIGASYS